MPLLLKKWSTVIPPEATGRFDIVRYANHDWKRKKIAPARLPLAPLPTPKKNMRLASPLLEGYEFVVLGRQYLVQ